MMMALGDQPLLTPDTLAAIQTQVTILRGDQDHMVSREESQVTASHIPDAVYTELPETPHPIEKADHKRLATQLKFCQ